MLSHTNCSWVCETVLFFCLSVLFQLFMLKFVVKPLLSKLQIFFIKQNTMIYNNMYYGYFLKSTLMLSILSNIFFPFAA